MRAEGNRTNGLHKIALAALFTVGSSLISYPGKQSLEELLLLFALSVAASVLPSLFLYPFLCRLFQGRLCGRRGRLLLAAPLAVFLAICALFFAYRSFADYTHFATERILSVHSRSLLAVGFLTVVVCLSRSSKKTVDAFALLSLGAFALPVILLFLVGIPHYEPRLE